MNLQSFNTAKTLLEEENRLKILESQVGVQGFRFGNVTSTANKDEISYTGSETCTVVIEGLDKFIEQQRNNIKAFIATRRSEIKAQFKQL